VKENLAFSNQSVDGTPRKSDGCEKKEKKRERENETLRMILF